ncbi:1-acyl-sn-glycerol-3-phosphate acyltransferase [Crocinitomicaceae bacterium]|nr:1-acyl-sn-glycerol-3-phosphate acyltransferase [Crocinitomicaceae bacterium]MDB3905965.1 1-acyl-sn-glycerol-3-phosphate acyltransferase [Crocinitomicaceae bacterium]
MRILYFILWITLRYSLRLFYPRLKIIGSPASLFRRTIYVGNHPASFMDPISVAALRNPSVFFMTRADIFTPALKPILWACQMLPIHRQHDGGDTRKKNSKSFDRASRVLKYNRSLLIFGEGFTDDVFIRRLKPVKKGAAKIGFEALEKLNWSKKIYVAAVGSNYSKPNQMRSDLLISTSEEFLLNDYRELYEENPNKAITTVTRRIEQMMQEQITHVQDKAQAEFHEQMMMLTRRGMNADSFDKSIPLERRWRYSQRLANWLNELDIEKDEKISKLKEDIAAYFKLIKRMRIEDNYVYWKQTSPKGERTKEVMMMIALFPFAILGLIHCGPWYILIKRFVEKSFRRKVFWGSVKLVAAKIIMGLVNLPVIWLFYYLIYPSWWMAITYYFAIGLFGLAAYMWFRYLKYFKTKGAINNAKMDAFIKKRQDLVERLSEVLPTTL